MRLIGGSVLAFFDLLLIGGVVAAHSTIGKTAAFVPVVIVSVAVVRAVRSANLYFKGHLMICRTLLWTYKIEISQISHFDIEDGPVGMYRRTYLTLVRIGGRTNRFRELSVSIKNRDVVEAEAAELNDYLTDPQGLGKLKHEGAEVGL